MFKNKLRHWCQQLFGLDRYLFVFARFSIFRLRYLGYDKPFHHFMQLIPAEGDILDIGANIGAMSVVLAQRFPQNQIHSFEPIPSNADALRSVKAFFALDNIQIHQTALGDAIGETSMLTPLVNGAVMHGLSHVWQGTRELPAAGTCTVPLTTLDVFQPIQQIGKISAIKIDVENFEYYVLSGGRQLLQKHKPIVYAELWNDEKKTPCITLMQELGYTVKIYRNGSLADYRGEDALNYFFLPY